LLVVIGIVMVLLSVTLLSLNISRQFAVARDARRTVDSQVLLNAISQYQIDQKTEISVIDATSRVIAAPLFTPRGSTTQMQSPEPRVNLCSLLVPQYIAAIPIDPSIQLQDVNCANYNSGYRVSRGEEGRIVVSAPLSETGPIILSR
jgi:type II secretory pathway pseudopilin PulG